MRNDKNITIYGGPFLGTMHNTEFYVLSAEHPLFFSHTTTSGFTRKDKLSVRHARFSAVITLFLNWFLNA
jgi:hypothetical protein